MPMPRQSTQARPDPPGWRQPNCPTSKRGSAPSSRLPCRRPNRAAIRSPGVSQRLEPPANRSTSSAVLESNGGRHAIRARLSRGSNAGLQQGRFSTWVSSSSVLAQDRTAEPSCRESTSGRALSTGYQPLRIGQMCVGVPERIGVRERHRSGTSASQASSRLASETASAQAVANAARWSRLPPRCGLPARAVRSSGVYRVWARWSKAHELLFSHSVAARSWSRHPPATSRIMSKKAAAHALRPAHLRGSGRRRGPCHRSSARTSACWSRP